MPKIPSKGKDLLLGAPGTSGSKVDRRLYDLASQTIVLLPEDER